jgi:hypothetical protein
MISLMKNALSAGAGMWGGKSAKFMGAASAMGSSVGSFFTKNKIGAGIGLMGIGGVASMMTGGTFMSGALMGGAGAFAGRGLHNRRAGLGKFASGAPKVGSRMQNALSHSGFTRSRAMMGGAALGGAIFGNRKNSHKRGFNSGRGARF